ncbi:MAG: chromosomal replication initiator DnaA [Alphaproteobacteria bacterium]|nr:chromosomal replication initiator DnaA [Alphaproteobacteria bacterium]
MFLRPAPPIPGLSAAAAAAAQAAPFAELFSVSRSRPSVARARQLAVYLDHVALGASVSACARTFARDRATIRHACATIEDLRDDPSFDAAARRLETALAAQRDMICALLAQGSAQ